MVLRGPLRKARGRAQPNLGADGGRWRPGARWHGNVPWKAGRGRLVCHLPALPHVAGLRDKGASGLERGLALRTEWQQCPGRWQGDGHVSACPASAQRQEGSPAVCTSRTTRVSAWSSGQALGRGLFTSGLFFWPTGICLLHLSGGRLRSPEQCGAPDSGEPAQQGWLVLPPATAHLLTAAAALGATRVPLLLEWASTVQRKTPRLKSGCLLETWGRARSRAPVHPALARPGAH